MTQLRLRGRGEIVYAQLAPALPRPFSGAGSARQRSGADPGSAQTESDGASHGESSQTAATHCERLAEIEMEAIRAAIVAFHGNMYAAAKQLGISRATLYRKLKPQRAA